MKTIWENKLDLSILHIKIRLYRNFHENLWKKIFDSFFRTILTSRGKYEDEDEKTWENEFDFGICHIKIRLCASFHESLRKKLLTIF